MLDHQILGKPLHLGVPMSTEPAATNSSLYVKVTNFPGLYRHSKSGRYYGVKKVHGRRKERSLDTADRKIAERRYKEWVANLDKVDTEVEKTTLAQLIERFQAVTQGLVQNTQVTNRAIINSFLKWWPHGPDCQVRNIRPSMLDEWLAIQGSRLRNTSYNRYAGFLKQLFEIAVKDRILAESPAKKLKTPWKNPQTPQRPTPTVGEFETIIECVRSQPFTDHADDSGDFLAFLGLAGVGQAEAAALKWGDVDWSRERINFKRQKTDTHFYAPIYPHLRPLLEKLKRQSGSKHANMPVFKIKDGKKALASACKKLGLPPFSQRALRRCLIVRQWKSRLDPKIIAKWQGHQDGGQLIIDTYTEICGDDDDEYEKQQIAKIKVASTPNREACT